MIEWISCYKLGSLAPGCYPQYITVGEQLWRLEPNNSRELRMFYSDFESQKSIKVEYTPDRMMKMKDAVLHSDDKYIYMIQEEFSPALWRFDTETKNWENTMNFKLELNTTIRSLYFHKNQIYALIYHYSNESLILMIWNNDKFDIISKLNDVKHAHFFEIDQKLYFYTLSKKLERRIDIIENDTLNLFHIEVCGNKQEYWSDIFTVDSCIYSLLYCQNRGSYYTELVKFDMKKLEWRGFLMPQVEDNAHISHSFYLKNHIYAIFITRSENHLYIGEEADSLQKICVSQIIKSYKLRLAGGESSVKLIKEIEELEVSNKLRKQILDATCWIVIS